MKKAKWKPIIISILFIVLILLPTVGFASSDAILDTAKKRYTNPCDSSIIGYIGSSTFTPEATLSKNGKKYIPVYVWKIAPSYKIEVNLGGLLVKVDHNIINNKKCNDYYYRSKINIKDVFIGGGIDPSGDNSLYTELEKYSFDLVISNTGSNYWEYLEEAAPLIASVVGTFIDPIASALSIDPTYIYMYKTGNTLLNYFIGKIDNNRIIASGENYIYIDLYSDGGFIKHYNARIATFNFTIQIGNIQSWAFQNPPNTTKDIYYFMFSDYHVELQSKKAHWWSHWSTYEESWPDITTSYDIRLILINYYNGPLAETALSGNNGDYAISAGNVIADVG